jgi:putative transposase
VQYVNKKYRRSGTLWEGRHKASIVDAENYLLICMRYIELNPVRAAMVRHPGEYPWSSYGVNAEGVERAMVEPHEVFLGLGELKGERMHRYRSLFEAQIEQCDIHAIRKATEYSVPLGGERFTRQIEKVLSRSVGYAKRGRPGVREDEGEYGS